MMNISLLLPEGFEQLEIYVADWDLATIEDRYAKRKSSPQTKLVDFYKAVLPHVSDMLAHLDKFDIYRLPEPERRLYRILCGLCEVSAAVELIGAPYLVPPAGSDLRYVKELDAL